MSQKPNELTDISFDPFLSAAHTPVLVDLWAPWCVPCRAMAPVIDKLAKDTAGKLAVAKLDVEKYPAIMERFGVRGIPTLLLFRGDGEPVRLVGAQTLGKLKTWLADQQVDVDAPPPAQHSEGLEWGSFYGDEELRQFIAGRVLAHAEAGALQTGLQSFWLDGKGTTSAAMVHQPDSQAFARVTGLPIALARLIDRYAYLTPEDVEGLFAVLQAGKDFRQAPLRFMHWWLGGENVLWAGYLRDEPLKQLLARWQALCAERLAGRETSPEAWAAVGELAAALIPAFGEPNRQLEKSIAIILRDLAPTPATTDEEKWNSITINMHWVLFQYLQILDGWSDDDRATPNTRFAWFKEKERQSPTGKLTQDDIAALRNEWETTHPAFIAKENAWHKNVEQLALPVNARMRQALNHILAGAPDF